MTWPTDRSDRQVDASGFRAFSTCRTFPRLPFVCGYGSSGVGWEGMGVCGHVIYVIASRWGMFHGEERRRVSHPTNPSVLLW